MKKMILILFLLTCAGYARENVKIYGKSIYRTVYYENIIGTAISSVTGTSTVDVDYEVRVLSASTTGYRCQYRNLNSGINTEYYILPSSSDATHVTGLTINYSSTIATGNRFTFSCDTDMPVQVDSLGGIYNAFYTYVKNDTIHAVSSTPDTVLLTGDYDKGLAIFSQQLIKFRTNKMTGWIFVEDHGSVFLPIYISSTDTLFVQKVSSIPDINITRGK